MSSLSRRNALKMMGTAAAAAGVGSSANANQSAFASELTQVEAWATTRDRVWLGAAFWANPMEDWRVAGGSAECQNGGGDRNIHLLTHQITDNTQGFEISVDVDAVELTNNDGGAGFKIGIRSDINEYRSNCFAKSGITAIVTKDAVKIGNKSAPRENTDGPVTLHLKGQPLANRQYGLVLTAYDEDGESLGQVEQQFIPSAILGNVNIGQNFSLPMNRKNGGRYRFANWKVGGAAFTVNSEQAFGPILWSMYSLSDSRSDEGFVLKLSALTGPMSEQDDHAVELMIQEDGAWKSLGTEKLHKEAWTATFRIPNWDETRTTPFKLVYREKSTAGQTEASEWAGTIRANPVGRPLRLGAMTCQNDYAFPYEPVAENVVKLDPDLLYFSGDQLYENHGGYGIIREPAPPAILNYLRKFYQFGWAFREAMRDRPTLCIPDDHDVFQGNIWGEGGAPMVGLDKGASSKGGYRQPPAMVNVVHKTCAGHHPDYYDPEPVKQGISVYYGDMVYGNVSFAILGDRQFKSGPEKVETGSGRADHVLDPEFDTSVLDKPGLVLLGERQEEFLKHWAGDWRGHSMKVLLSQTVFSGVATHHGGYNGYLKADLDSGGWPQTARNRTIEILRDSKALHINGDQHLTTLSQYGVDKQRDSNWSFCTPAIAAGYPRWWRPDEVGMEHQNRPAHGRPQTGEYLDGFGNKVYVYAVGNPLVGKDRNRYKRAHEKGSGFGFVTIDTEAKTYFIQSFRFLIDPLEEAADNQFPGWPVTLHQAENAGENRLG